MKKLIVIILISVSSIFAIDRPNITYLKTHSAEYDATYKDMGNRTIRWIVKADKKLLLRLVSHIRYMKEKINSGVSPRKTDLLFNIENIMGKYVHYKIGFENGMLIIDKSADNDCAFEIMKVHAKAVKEDFIDNADLTKNYSELAKQIIASPACKSFQTILNK
jgi:hypothetical protein